MTRHNKLPSSVNPAEDLASTNTTLSAFLGGKQKSWMTGQAHTASVLQAGKRRFTSHNSNPSHNSGLNSSVSPPNPTLEFAPIDGGMASSTNFNPSRGSSAFNNVATLPSPAPSAEELDFDAEQPRSKSKEPSYNSLGLALHEKRKSTTDGQSGTKRVRSGLSSPAVNGQQSTLTSEQVRASLGQVLSPLLARPASAVQLDLTVDTVPISANGRSGTTVPVPEVSRPVAQSPLEQPPSRSDSIAVVPSTLPFDWQTLQRRLDTHVAERGGAQNLLPVELSRLRCLRNACGAKDYQMLLLHQCLYLHKTNRPNLFPITSSRDVELGVRRAEKLLDLTPGSYANPHISTWYCRFPTAPEDFKGQNQSVFDYQLSLVRDSLEMLGKHYTPFVQAHGSSRQPPLIHNIIKTFHTTSTELQDIIWTATCSEMFSSPRFVSHITPKLTTQQHHQLRLIFKANQEWHYKEFANVQSRQHFSQLEARFESYFYPRYQAILGLLQIHGQSANWAHATPPHDQVVNQTRRSSIPLAQNPQSPQIAPPHWPPKTFGGPAGGHPLVQPATHLGEHQGLPQPGPIRQIPFGHTPEQPALSYTLSSNALAPQTVTGMRDPRGNQVRMNSTPSGTGAAHLQHNALQQQVTMQQAQMLYRQQADTLGRNLPQQGTPIVPGPTYRASILATADPTRTAMHQLHLRDPVLKVIGLKSPQELVLRHVSSFALSPQPITGDTIQNWTFEGVAELHEELKHDGPSAANRLVKTVGLDAKAYRIRCVSYTEPATLTSDSKWADSGTLWPPHATVVVNGKIVEIRRKLHHGKDLPIEITSLMQNGSNHIQMSLLRTAEDEYAKKHAIAVEVITLSTCTDVREHCERVGFISAERMIEEIRGKLSIDDDDDELAIVGDNFVSINLFDPYMISKMPKTPVRGKACLHRDCFDLDTLLEGRQGVSTYGVSDVDVWKCPRCRGDIRPQTLIQDGYIVKVQEQLKSMGKEDVGTIEVDAEGRWRPKGQKEWLTLE